MDLTFQDPMQYCSLQQWTLLLSPVTSTNGYCFCFGSNPSFFLELFLHWSPVAYWVPTDLGSSSSSILSFCLFILFIGFSRQEYWSGLHSLLQWTTFCLPLAGDYSSHRPSLVAQWSGICLPMQETRVWSLGWEDRLEKGKVIHFSILAWRIPQTKEPGGL